MVNLEKPVCYFLVPQSVKGNWHGLMLLYTVVRFLDEVVVAEVENLERAEGDSGGFPAGLLVQADAKTLRPHKGENLNTRNEITAISLNNYVALPKGAYNREFF